MPLTSAFPRAPLLAAALWLWTAAPAFASGRQPAASAVTARVAENEACVPAWPASAMGRGESGTTRLLLRVAPDGTVTDAKLKSSSGFGDLDQATIMAARACRFAPKLRAGVPVATSVAFDHLWERGLARSSAGASSPALRKRCAPLVYPAASLSSGEHGTVHMTFLIGADGTVLEKNVVKSSGFDALDHATLDALAQCAFAPAVTNGTPEKSLLSFSYTWTLN